MFHRALERAHCRKSLQSHPIRPPIQFLRLCFILKELFINQFFGPWNLHFAWRRTEYKTTFVKLKLSNRWFVLFCFWDYRQMLNFEMPSLHFQIASPFLRKLLVLKSLIVSFPLHHIPNMKF